MNSLLAAWVLLLRDLKLAMRRRGEWLTVLMFFVMVISLFPLSSEPDVKRLAEWAPAVTWVAALLASLLGLEAIFRSDFDDGVLEQLLLSPHPAPLLLAAKVLAHWLINGLPLVLLGPVLAYMLGLRGEALVILSLTLLLGTPVLSWVGAIGVALTVGLHRGGALLALLVLPLYVPVLIFAANAVGVAAQGFDVSGQLYLLAAMLVASTTLAPWVVAAALRISLE